MIKPFSTLINKGMKAVNCKRSIASTYPSYPNFFIITSTSWKIRAKNPNIREVDYGNTTCYSGKTSLRLGQRLFRNAGTAA